MQFRSLSSKNDAYFILSIHTLKSFRIKYPLHTRRDQSLSSYIASYRGNSSYPILLPLDKLDFSGHLSGDRDLCAHLVSWIVSTLDHLLVQPGWDSHQGGGSTAAFSSLHVPEKKAHFFDHHNLT